MDNWNAPQWADFNGSVVSDVDEYFSTEHKELEPDRSDDTPYGSFTDSPNSKADVSDSSYDTPRSNGFASPTVTGTSGGCNSRLNKTGESLASAMSGLQIKSAKKALTKRSLTPSALRLRQVTVYPSLTASIIEDDENIETNVKKTETVSVTEVDENECTEITQERRQESSASGDNNEEENADNNVTLVASKEDADSSTPERVENIDAVEAEKLLRPENDAEKLEIENSEGSAKVSDKEILRDRSEPEEKLNNAQSKLSKLESRLDPSKRIILEKKNVRGNEDKPRVLTSQVRRYSIAKYHRRSTQFVSLAEAISRFQNGTPERFRSTNHKDYKAAPLQKAKQTTMKLTCPMSPALRCKLRARAVSVPNQESQIRFKPISKPSAVNAPLRKLEKKSTTFPRSCPSAQEKTANNVKPLRKIEKIPPVSSSEQKTAMHPPKSMPILKKVEKMLSESISSKDKSLMSTSIMSESMRNKHTPCKKTVPTVVSTDEGIAIKDVEILHFGIPVGHDYKKITRTMPFSFDTRNKELQSKKEKLKNQQIEEEKSKKSLFHARPAPSFNTAKKTTSVLQPKENNANKENPMTRTLSFQERNELALKKKKELMDQIVEQEKQARIFHAKPAPTFKPVFVRGNSTENLRLGDGNKRKTRGISPATRQKALSQESLGSANQENKAPNVANQQCPKFKNPLITHNLKLKKTAK